MVGLLVMLKVFDTISRAFTDMYLSLAQPVVSSALLTNKAL